MKHLAFFSLAFDRASKLAMRPRDLLLLLLLLLRHALISLSCCQSCVSELQLWGHVPPQSACPRAFSFGFRFLSRS